MLEIFLWLHVGQNKKHHESAAQTERNVFGCLVLKFKNFQASAAPDLNPRSCHDRVHTGSRRELLICFHFQEKHCFFNDQHLITDFYCI